MTFETSDIIWRKKVCGELNTYRQAATEQLLITIEGKIEKKRKKN